MIPVMLLVVELSVLGVRAPDELVKKTGEDTLEENEMAVPVIVVENPVPVGPPEVPGGTE